MLIVVRDEGPGFDPSSIPGPIAGRNIFSEGGRGIYEIEAIGYIADPGITNGWQ
ncbi:MAG: hypothetical protein JW793_05235 [Acidobacteria bacterium]|nr:hypothetical protein [Acidobacteriota bacterium]